MAIVVEELHALGANSFCIVGGCGTLQPSVSLGELIVADRAIRDEGTSYHYLEPADTVAASPTLVTELERQADERGSTTHTGPTWTTDAFYRETTAEIEAVCDAIASGTRVVLTDGSPTPRAPRVSSCGARTERVRADVR